jgi:hypothetical protein
MTEVTRENLKKWAIAIVTEVEPDDAFVVEDGFDALVEEWHRADAQDEGRFIGGVKTAVGSLFDQVLDRRATKTTWRHFARK